LIGFLDLVGALIFSIPPNSFFGDGTGAEAGVSGSNFFNFASSLRIDSFKLVDSDDFGWLESIVSLFELGPNYSLIAFSFFNLSSISSTLVWLSLSLTGAVRPGSASGFFGAVISPESLLF